MNRAGSFRSSRGSVGGRFFVPDAISAIKEFQMPPLVEVQAGIPAYTEFGQSSISLLYPLARAGDIPASQQTIGTSCARLGRPHAEPGRLGRARRRVRIVGQAQARLVLVSGLPLLVDAHGRAAERESRGKRHVGLVQFGADAANGGEPLTWAAPGSAGLFRYVGHVQNPHPGRGRRWLPGDSLDVDLPACRIVMSSLESPTPCLVRAQKSSRDSTQNK